MHKHRFLPMETFLSLHMLTFGGVLLHSSNTFLGSSGYLAMAAIAPEWVWAIICILTGLSLIVSMFSKNKRLEITSLSVMTAIWLFIGTTFIVSFLLTGILTTGVTYLPVAAFSFWLARKVGGSK